MLWSKQARLKRGILDMKEKTAHKSSAAVVRLRVWWIPQIPLKKGEEPFYIDVSDIYEAKRTLDVLADYDMYQLEHNIKPDFSNVGGVELFEDGEWLTWIDPETGLDFEDYFEEVKEA